MASPKIWLPQAQEIAVPDQEIQIARELITGGQRIFGYLVKQTMEAELDLAMLADDALNNFPSSVPIMIIKPDKMFAPKGFNRPLARFMFMGSREAVVNCTKGQLLGGFESSQSFGWLASQELEKRAMRHA